jgi:hypothetical protein
MVSVFVGLAIWGFASVSHAQDAGLVRDGVAFDTSSAQLPVTVAPQERENRRLPARRWYGWQVLSVDFGSMGLGVAALYVAGGDGPNRENTTQALLLLSAIGYGAGGPAFHLIHRQPWHALGSLALRGGLPLMGGALGLTSATCPPPEGDYGNCGALPMIVGAAAGAVLAIVLDSTVLAWDRPRDDASSQARFGLSPVVARDGRRELRVFATF